MQLPFPLCTVSIALVILLVCLISMCDCDNLEGTTNLCDEKQCQHPIIKDPNLKLELIYQGDFKYALDNLSPVSSMTILSSGDILLLDKNNGTVYRIQNNTLSVDPVLDIDVANKRERGLLGIATSYGNADEIFVFLYYTEAKNGDGTDVCPKKWYSDAYHCKPKSEPLGNRLYKYELKNNKLINPQLILELPAAPSPTHNGGVIKIGPDNNLYVTVGDLLGGTYINSSTAAQNLNETNRPDGRSGILRTTQDGNPVGKGILGDSMPLRLYYAYGIRNSFGLDFDPLTGNLWDTENGPEFGDEINLVQPGFNSGWERVQGIWEPIENIQYDSDLIAGNILLNPDAKMVDFNGNGRYSTPEFTLNFSIGPTAIKFLNSDKLGKQYKNDLFVASLNLGVIFHFDLLKDRTSLKLQSSLRDKIVDNRSELDKITFVRGLGGITDMDVGPDGYMYILSNYMGKATIFRIIPAYIPSD